MELINTTYNKKDNTVVEVTRTYTEVTERTVNDVNCDISAHQAMIAKLEAEKLSLQNTLK